MFSNYEKDYVENHSASITKDYPLGNLYDRKRNNLRLNLATRKLSFHWMIHGLPKGIYQGEPFVQWENEIPVSKNVVHQLFKETIVNKDSSEEVWDEIFDAVEKDVQGAQMVSFCNYSFKKDLSLYIRYCVLD